MTLFLEGIRFTRPETVPTRRKVECNKCPIHCGVITRKNLSEIKSTREFMITAPEEEAVEEEEVEEEEEEEEEVEKEVDHQTKSREKHQIIPRRTFPCKQCPYKTHQIGQLRRHVMKKHEDLQRICSLCGKKFSNLKSVQSHQLAVHEPAKCRSCNVQCKDSKALKNHKLRLKH